MSGYVIVHHNTPSRAVRHYASERAAKISLAAKNRKAGYAAYKVISEEERRKTDKLVIVHNLMSGKPVEIRESDVGSCCDPSTERYWSM